MQIIKQYTRHPIEAVNLPILQGTPVLKPRDDLHLSSFLIRPSEINNESLIDDNISMFW
jgi:hypothetical protein